MLIRAGRSRAEWSGEPAYNERGLAAKIIVFVVVVVVCWPRVNPSLLMNELVWSRAAKTESVDPVARSPGLAVAMDSPP